jgi:hypothetical protein
MVRRCCIVNLGSILVLHIEGALDAIKANGPSLGSTDEVVRRVVDGLPTASNATYSSRPLECPNYAALVGQPDGMTQNRRMLQGSRGGYGPRTESTDCRLVKVCRRAILTIGPTSLLCRMFHLRSSSGSTIGMVSGDHWPA